MWSRPIAGYADANGDGMIGVDEVQLADSSRFLGITSPRMTTHVHSTFGFLNNQLTLRTTTSYASPHLQIANAGYALLRAANDPAAPLDQQAALAASTGLNFAGLSQRVSTLRLSGLSLAYNLTPSVARRFNVAAGSVALDGVNLFLRTSYQGVDPDVNSSLTGEEVIDRGVLPEPREWRLRVNVTL